MVEADKQVDKQVLILERRLSRERSARLQAESIAETQTRQLYERNRSLELLSSIAEIGIQALPADTAFGEALQMLCDGTGWDCASIELLDPTATQAMGATLRGSRDEEQPDPLTRLLGHPAGLMSEVLLYNRPCWVEDLRDDERFSDLAWSAQMVELGGLSLLGVPIYFAGSIRAVLLLAHSQPRVRDEQRLDLVTHAAIQFGHMIEREIAQHQLVQARIDAESALQARNEFLAVMSHEMRTPMNGVLGMAQLALAAAPDARLTKYLRTIVDSGERMMEMVSMLLDMANLNAGRVELEAYPFSVREQLGRAIAPFEKLALKKQLAFHCDIDAGVPDIAVGDAVRLGQVVSHVVANAVKFTGSGSISIRVDASSRDITQSDLRVTVTDTGIGIPREKQAEIFAPFRQADGSATRNYEGAGLGLALSQNLITMMDGSIRVESQPGVGSTFVITAPLRLP